jgi:excisionase family DNA binding protein
MEPLLTSDELATYLRVDVVTIRRLVNRGELTAYRVGGEYRFMEPDIAEYLQRQRVQANENALSDPVSRVGPLASLFRRIFPEERDRFERFTNRARKAMNLAIEEALKLQHNYVGTEHLLLGLLREKEGVAALALHNLGIDLGQARHLTEQIIGIGKETVIGGQPGLTPRAKHTIELAVEEAKSLGHRYLGTEHLLLGIVREGEGVACKIIETMGVALDAVRAEVIRMIGEKIALPKILLEATDIAAAANVDVPHFVCSSCGTKSPTSFRYCFNCGHALTQPSESSGSQENEEQSSS